VPVVVIFMTRSRLENAGVVLPPDWQVRYLTAAGEAEIVAAFRDADCILSLGSEGEIGAGLMDVCRNLKFIQCFGSGFNQVDAEAAGRRGIAVANAPGQNAGTVAEFTIGCIIALQRRLVESDAAVKAGRYADFRPQVLKTGMQEIGGSRIGLVGFGYIGREVARIASVLGASVVYHTKRRQPVAVEKEYKVSYRHLDELLAESDIVSLHVPLNESTRGMIGARELALMKAGSLLVNTARGLVVDQAALAAALESGHLGGAAVDTFDPEPPPADHPLLSLSADAQRRLLLSAHTAGLTVPSFRRLLDACIDNIKRVLAGEPPLNQVNRT
jgi:phosphoglycerate dehydrogenase-like enzyme